MIDIDSLSDKLNSIFSMLSEDDKREVAYRLAWFDDDPYENYAVLSNILNKYQKGIKK